MPFDTQELSGLHRTAFSAAALRAAHTLCGGEPRIFNDELALHLIEMSADDVIALADRVPAASASTCVLRSRFTEDRLNAARERVNQYVILGAGLDSYALRMGSQLKELTVFEVDDPQLQALKRQKIESLGWSLPHQLRFVPCDFEQMSIAKALVGQEFEEYSPCFISWLGVTQYLTRQAIGETLKWAAGCPTGSEIVLTFLESNSQAENLKATMAETGVTVHSHFMAEEMSMMLQSAGFSTITHLTPDEANEIYFRNRSDGLRAPEIQRLVSAVV